MLVQANSLAEIFNIIIGAFFGTVFTSFVIDWFKDMQKKKEN